MIPQGEGSVKQIAAQCRLVATSTSYSMLTETDGQLNSTAAMHSNGGYLVAWIDWGNDHVLRPSPSTMTLAPATLAQNRPAPLQISGSTCLGGAAFTKFLAK